MRDPQASAVGERIRFNRIANHKTQAVVAGLAGITEDYLSQVERGLKMPSFATLQRIAEVLRLSPAALLDNRAPSGPDLPRVDVADVRRAMTTPWLTRGRPDAPGIDQLAGWVANAWDRWQHSSTRYSDSTTLLATLTVDLNAAFAARGDLPETDARRLAGVAADLHFLLRSYFRRTGQLDLALLAAERSLLMATEADDPCRLAAARWNLCHALLASDEPATAADLAGDAIGHLEPWATGMSDQDGLALLGALHLVIAEASARSGHAEASYRHLAEAGSIAATVGERNTSWTAFGPTNTAIHAVNVELHLGKVDSALATARSVDAGRAATVERRLTFLLEVGACHERLQADDALLDHLLQAERLAAEDLRHNPIAHQLVNGLVARAGRSSASDVRGLATRVGLLAS